jgi:type III secretion protein L
MEEKIIKARLAPEAPLGPEAPLAPPRVLKRDVHDAGVEARGIIEAAERQAQTLLAEAHRLRDDSLEASRRQGYREGLAQWDEARSGMLRARESLDAKYEGELVRLSVKVAEKIIGEELRTRPETIVSIVRECLFGIRNAQNLTVRVNPEEREEVLRQIDSLQREVGLSNIQVIADASVSRGGCIVESERGIVDARLETQLRRLEDILVRIANRQ